MTSRLSSHAARLRELINHDPCLDFSDGSSQFRTMALDLFAFQFEHNAAYRQLCLARTGRPETIADWPQIPAVPSLAFKELDLTCLPPAARTKTFCSSGTTKQKPSCHAHNAESIAVYEASLLASFKTALLREPSEKLRCVFLTPSPEQAPTSSLVHMFETIRSHVGMNGSRFIGRVAADGSWSFEVDSLVTTLSQCNDHPVALLGTAFNFVHLMDALAERRLRFNLPSGSRVMETGGYKGRSRLLPKAELHGLIQRFLGITSDHVVCEYGMCELGSQAYDHSLNAHARRVGRRFRFPPWVRFFVVSPETGLTAADGELGLLRVFDLANVASVLAIQTEDLAVRREDGFELLGRAALAEPRGCSLMSL
jgi:hypothetical protein